MPTIDSIVLDYDSQLDHSFLFTDQFAPYGKHECKAKNEIGETIKAYYIRKGFPPGPVLNVSTKIDHLFLAIRVTLYNHKLMNG